MHLRRLVRRVGTMLAALALASFGPAALAESRPAPRQGTAAPILAKPAQREREAIALRIWRTAKFQAEVKKAKAVFARSPLAQNPDAQRTLDVASEALAFSAALSAANYDTVRPNIMWGTNAGHRWMGHRVPSSGYGLDSPDNVYRSATFDGSGRYVVRGTIHEAGPTQQTFVVYRGLPGVTRTMVAGRMDEIAGIKSEDIVRDARGNYTLTIDADPANGRVNHLQVPADLSGMHLTIRDSLGDWARDLPVELTIERLDTPAGPGPDRSFAAMTDRAVSTLQGSAPFWVNWYETYVHTKPLNAIPEPWRRGQGWGFTQQGRFAFAPDEVWLITFDPLGARFFDMQISDPWTKAVEYVSRNGSLNGGQVHRNADGTITMVASPRDPGVYNWLDTAGLNSGTFQARWQALPPGATNTGAVREARVIKLADLRANLPAGTRFVTPAERAQQLKQRKAAYARRLR
jgi:hypothetical protein